MLRCPPGTLVRAIAVGGGRAVPLRAAPEDWTTWLTAGEAVRQALVELDLTDVAEALPVLNAQSVMHIGSDGEPPHLDAQTLHYASRDGVQRRVSVLHYKQPVAERPELSELVGLTEGRLIGFPQLGLFLTELLLPRPLQRGETVLVSTRSAWPSSVPGRREHWLVTTRVHGEVLIWVQFHPDAIPQHCETFIETADTHVETPVDPGLGSAHLRLHNFGPGRAGIRWSRPETRVRPPT